MLPTLMQYVLPKSVTFWAGLMMLLSRLMIALSTVFPEIGAVATMLQQAWGMTGTQLIAAGLTGIGLRKAVGDLK